MTLPRWNPAWDPPDPLQGRRGWAGRHRGNLLFSVAFLASVLVLVPGVLFPALARHRRKEAELERDYRHVQETIERAAGNSSRTR